MIKWCKGMQTSLVMSTTENHWWSSTSSSTDVAQHSNGVSRIGSQLLCLHHKQNIRAWQHQFKKHCTWKFSGEFRHRTELSNSNWRGQPELYQIDPKTSYAQQEPAFWDKISLHSGQDGRWNFFNSIRCYWQNGSRHLPEIHNPTFSWKLYF